MADWTGAGLATADIYRRMAEREVAGISPTYERLCRGISDDPRLITLIDRVPGPKRQPNLLLGAVRYLDGPVDTYTEFAAWTQEHWDDVEAVMLTHRTQTNEAGRCATLLPVLAPLDGPLALIEIGASAGLCLYPDRLAYRYEHDDGTVHEVGEASVTLTCRTTGPVPWPRSLPEVAWRGGLDLNPLDVTDADDVRWLKALVWPEQIERRDRMDAIVTLARHGPPLLRRGDLLTDLADVLETVPRDATPVVFHSAVLAYLGPADRHAAARSISALMQRHDGVWISNEAPGVVPGTVDVMADGPSRFVVARDGRPVALAGPHGQSLDWLPA